VRQAKVLRYQGRVSESLEYPQRSLLQSKHEAWFEDARPGLICELGDVYCELGDQLSAERLLEVEIKFQDDRGRKNSTDWCLLQLSRAESLLGHGRLDEDKTLCSELRQYSRLSKFDRLRLSTLFGRIYHDRSDWSNARHY